MKVKPAKSKSIPRDVWIKAAIILLLAGVLAVLVYTLNKSAPIVDPDNVYDYGYYKAQVTQILFDDAEPDYELIEGRRIGRQEVEVVFKNGPYKGETYTIDNYLTAFANVDCREGLNVIVRYQDYGNGNLSVLVYNYNRSSVVYIYAALLAVLLIIVGGKKGLMSLLGLIFTLICLWFLLIPLMMRGYNILLLTIVIISLATAFALLILGGFTRKTYSAILGCILGVVVAGVFSSAATLITPLDGLNMLDAERLVYYATEGGMKVSGLLVCGVLIASLGAVMDVAMSLSSSASELHELNPDLSVQQLFLSTMNIGKDAMGTMANTLILALIGSSLNTFILTHAYEIPFSQLFNTDFIVIELIQGISGTIGIVLTVPFVAFISSQMVTFHAGKKSDRTRSKR